MKNHKEEILDIVNEQDQVVGQLPRHEVNNYFLEQLSKQPGESRTFFVRAINAFIENEQGQLWIPRRTATKKLFPLCLDVGVGGAVDSGETYEQALFREVQEETNIDLNVTPYEFICHVNPQKHTINCFMKVYKIIVHDAPNYNQDDFCEYFWLTPQELRERLNAGEAAKSDLPKLLKIVYNV